MAGIDADIFLSAFLRSPRLIALHVKIEVIPFTSTRYGFTLVEKIRRIEAELTDKRRLALFFDMCRFDAYDRLIFVIFIVHSAIIGCEI